MDFSLTDEQKAIRDTVRSFMPQGGHAAGGRGAAARAARRARHHPRRVRRAAAQGEELRLLGHRHARGVRRHGPAGRHPVADLDRAGPHVRAVPVRRRGRQHPVLRRRAAEAGVPAPDHQGRADLLLRDHRAGRRVRRGEHPSVGPPRTATTGSSTARRRSSPRATTPTSRSSSRSPTGRRAPHKRLHRVPRRPVDGLDARSSSRPWARAARRRWSSTTCGCPTATSSASSARASSWR